MPNWTNGATMSPTLQRKALARFVNRYTMEHIPAWARRRPCDSGGTETRYYAPQYRTDAEWLANTDFALNKAGTAFDERHSHCMTHDATFPLGKWLDAPFQRQRAV